MGGCSLWVPTLLGGDVALAWHAPGGALRRPYQRHHLSLRPGGCVAWGGCGFGMARYWGRATTSVPVAGARSLEEATWFGEGVAFGMARSWGRVTTSGVALAQPAQPCPPASVRSTNTPQTTARLASRTFCNLGHVRNVRQETASAVASRWLCIQHAVQCHPQSRHRATAARSGLLRVQHAAQCTN